MSTELLWGTWKLVSCVVIHDNEPPKHQFGEHPKGVLILTRGGRMTLVLTSEHRKAGTGDQEMAALFRSMIAYSGKYRRRLELAGHRA